MSRNLSIGIDASNLRDGGGATHLIEVLANLIPHQHGIGRIVVWGPAQTVSRLPQRDWLEVHSPSIMRAGPLRRLSWQHRELSAIARQAECDLLFSPGGTYTGDFRPFVTMSRNMEPFDFNEIGRSIFSAARIRLEILRRLQSASFKQATGLIFLSDFARISVTKFTGDVAGRVVVIPHGVGADFSTHDREYRPVESCSSNNPLRLVYVSRLAPYKHQWHVVHAVKALRDDLGLPLSLDLVGPATFSSSAEMLNGALRECDPSGIWVNVHGEIAKGEIQYLYQRSDIGIFASSCENMPNILLEKMAAGLPIVCSDRGPMPEVLADAGVYFDPEDRASIASALKRLIDSPNLRQVLGQRAAERASKYSWGRCSHDTFDFISKIARGCGVSGVRWD